MAWPGLTGGEGLSTTIDAFGARVAELLAIDLAGDISLEDSLYDDWGLDSLQAFQLIIIIEGMADVLVPPEETPVLFTVQDAYQYYCVLLASDSS